MLHGAARQMCSLAVKHAFVCTRKNTQQKSYQPSDYLRCACSLAEQQATEKKGRLTGKQFFLSQEAEVKSLSCSAWYPLVSTLSVCLVT